MLLNTLFIPVDDAGTISFVNPSEKIESRNHWFGSKYHFTVCMLSVTQLLPLNLGISKTN